MKKGMHKLFVYISCFCLCMSFFIVPVSAESDLMYPDTYSYTAYNYFFNSGYSHLILTTSSGITYNVDLDNKGTNNGTITGTDGLSGSSHETGTVGTNGSATLGSKYMTCTTNNAVSGTQTYSCYFSDRSGGYGSNSQSINIQMNENTYESFNDVDINVNETIKQNIDTDITGSITSSMSSSSYVYLPWLKGTYQGVSGLDNTKWVYLSDNSSQKDILLVFYTYVNVSDKSLTFYDSGGITYEYSFNSNVFGGMRLNVIYIKQKSGAGNVNFNINGLGSKDVLPIYFGRRNSINNKTDK